MSIPAAAGAGRVAGFWDMRGEARTARAARGVRVRPRMRDPFSRAECGLIGGIECSNTNSRAENVLNRLPQVSDDHHTERPRLPLMQIAIPRGDQNRVAAQETRRLHIGQPVADPPRARKVDVERRLRLLEQLEARFAAVAGSTDGTGELRVVRADVRGVDASALGSTQFVEPLLHSFVV